MSKPDRRTAVDGLSAAMREVRIGIAKDQMHKAVQPLGHHCQSLRLALEIDDDLIVEHHVKAIVDGVNEISRRNREIRAIRVAPPVDVPDRWPAPKEEIDDGKERSLTGSGHGRRDGSLPGGPAAAKAEGAGARDDRGRPQGGNKDAVDHK